MVHDVPLQLILRLDQRFHSALRAPGASFWLLRDLWPASSHQRLNPGRREVLETQAEQEWFENFQEEGGASFPSQVEVEVGGMDHFLFFLHLPLLRENLNLQP